MEKFGEGLPAGDYINRVVGVHNSEFIEKSIRINATRAALEPLEYRGIERDKSTSEKLLVLELLREVPEMLREYGLESKKLLHYDNVHFLDKKASDSEQAKKFLEHNLLGAFRGHEIWVLPESLMEVAHVLTHEIIHLQSFSSFQPTKDLEALTKRRSGLSALNTEDVERLALLNGLDEAVTEELALRIKEKYLVSKPELKDFPDTLDGYREERERFNDLLDLLYEKNKDDFKDREEIFKLFTKAKFSGRLLPLARVYEKSFGRGAFKRLQNWV